MTKRNKIRRFFLQLNAKRCQGHGDINKHKWFIDDDFSTTGMRSRCIRCHETYNTAELQRELGRSIPYRKGIL